MADVQLTKKELRFIDTLVSHFIDNREVFRRLHENVNTLFSNPVLMSQVHSMKSRIKDSEHLRDKLIRKAKLQKSEKKYFEINKDNLFEKITDLVGFRILHLHKNQFEKINEIVLDLIKEERWELVEGPKARTWDDEYREYFRKLKVENLPSSDTMYTSVHYLLKVNKQAVGTCELQIRTLAEELWGEVDHAINYPYKSQSFSCQEQIKVLARFTSGCTRLVDSIFESHREHEISNKPKANIKKTKSTNRRTNN